ncbi:hypothetical protein [Marinifilum sp.]|uniref:hypothetical protein n=1 Tax=Marinifilum sp. TaxID=2033137 RepID=UPI003BAB381C
MEIINFKKGILTSICAILLFACDNSEEFQDNPDYLRDKFNGKYELISSASKKAVDLNNDGNASTNLLDENSMILLSTIEIRIPRVNEIFIENNEFVFNEIWPTENEHRLKNKDLIALSKTYNGEYDLYGNTSIGKFKDDLKSGTFRNEINNDEKNTLVELKSIDFLNNDKVEVTLIRKLYTINGWVKTQIKSEYKRFSSNT